MWLFKHTTRCLRNAYSLLIPDKATGTNACRRITRRNTSSYIQSGACTLTTIVTAEWEYFACSSTWHRCWNQQYNNDNHWKQTSKFNPYKKNGRERLSNNQLLKSKLWKCRTYGKLMVRHKLQLHFLQIQYYKCIEGLNKSVGNHWHQIYYMFVDNHLHRIAKKFRSVPYMTWLLKINGNT